ncbi:ParA family protein [Cytobacillus firmus]|uniref:ParA family protein n=1 Tax=Cytobacillus firmus TaxID=1399 RepID=UPI00237A0A84|nr:ParA family protein [Cytobacillus firmus]MDD9309783.1 ParA family protein [Cytobacillus firmus]
MNIIVVSKNSLYKELFESNEYIETVLQWEELKKSNISVQAVYLDGESFDVNRLSEIRDMFPEQEIFFKPGSINSDLIMKTITRLCAAYKVKALNEYLTYEQTVEEILNQITNRQDYISKRIISFFGTHSGSGVSTTVLNLARSLSQQVKEKVLVLSLNSWDPADYFYQYDGQYLNDLKVDLKTHSLTVARLTEVVSYHESFYHLAGNRDIKMQRFYKPHEIETLIKVAQEVFDVILIDAGTHFDTAPTVQSYLSSNLKFLVTNQEEKGYRGYFPYVFQQLIEPVGGKSDDFMLVINKYQPSNTLINEKALEEELNMTKVATIPDMGDMGSIATYQKKLLYDIADTFYTKNIDLISNLIVSECKLTETDSFKDDKKDKRKMFSIFK